MIDKGGIKRNNKTKMDDKEIYLVLKQITFSSQVYKRQLKCHLKESVEGNKFSYIANISDSVSP